MSFGDDTLDPSPPLFAVSFPLLREVANNLRRAAEILDLDSEEPFDALSIVEQRGMARGLRIAAADLDDLIDEEGT